MASARPSSTRFCRPIRQLADLHLADVLDLQKVDDLLDRRRCSISSASAGPDAQDLPEEAAAHLQRPARHDVVERGHALEQRDVLKGAGDAAARRLIGPHAPSAVLPLKVMRPCCG